MKVLTFKKIWRVFMVVSLVGFISFFEIKEFHAKRVFFQSELNTIIIRVEGNVSGGRSYDYITREDIVITLMNCDTLFVGDSVVKKKNDYLFKLYRKNKSGNYEYKRIYDLK
ncbi:MAG TPA: hypothetical protein VFK73_09235 [Paludibacter sp.]|nr:hypothetical protein [Paludibacter sp.]